jgi:hypothetical protein
MLPRRDPADRFLVATAQILDLTLVTADDNLLRLGTIRSMKNWPEDPGLRSWTVSFIAENKKSLSSRRLSQQAHWTQELATEIETSSSCAMR